MKQHKKLFGAFPLALVLLFGMSANAQQTATATATLFNNFVVGITVTYGGSGYGWAPYITITGGGGTGAGAYATISNGVVTAITVTNAGYGYTSTPQVLVAAPATTPFSSSLILDLPLDDSVVDVGPNDFTVINNGGGTWVPNRFSQAESALALNGVDQNIEIPYDSRLYPDEFTLSGWFNFQQLYSASEFTLWQVGNSSSDIWRGFQIVLYAPGYGFLYQDYTGSGVNVQLFVNLTNFVGNEWCQIVVSRTTNSAAVFVNGVKVASQTGLTPYAKPQVTPMSLGADNDPSGSGFYEFCPVSLDTVHIYNRALADSEVNSLYTNEVTGLVPTVGVVIKTIRINMMQLVPGQTYQLENSTNLSSWTDVGTPFVATNSAAYYDVDIIGTAIGFFQVVESALSADGKLSGRQFTTRSPSWVARFCFSGFTRQADFSACHHSGPLRERRCNRIPTRRFRPSKPKTRKIILAGISPHNQTRSKPAWR